MYFMCTEDKKFKHRQTFLRSVELLDFTSVKEASSLISSAKDKGGLGDPSLSSIRSFRLALETNSRDTGQHERRQITSLCVSQ